MDRDHHPRARYVSGLDGDHAEAALGSTSPGPLLRVLGDDVVLIVFSMLLHSGLLCGYTCNMNTQTMNTRSARRLVKATRAKRLGITRDRQRRVAATASEHLRAAAIVAAGIGLLAVLTLVVPAAADHLAAVMDRMSLLGRVSMTVGALLGITGIGVACLFDTTKNRDH